MKTKKVIALISNDFEDLELWYPVLRLREEGIEVILTGEKSKEKYIGKYGVPAISDDSYLSINYKDYDGILVPGGWSPDYLRRVPRILEMIQYFHEEKKPIGQICHAGWVLISAGILKGINVTSTPGIKDDMTNAGAIWHDAAVITDGHIISSRRPPDLPEYLPKFIEALKK